MELATTKLGAGGEGRRDGWRADGGARAYGGVAAARASKPKAFLLLKPGSRGLPEARPGRGVHHVEAERWDEAREWLRWAVSAVPVRRTVGPADGTAWLNQQRGL